MSIQSLYSVNAILFLFTDQNGYHSSFAIDSRSGVISQVMDVNQTGIISVKVKKNYVYVYIFFFFKFINLSCNVPKFMVISVFKIHDIKNIFL